MTKQAAIDAICAWINAGRPRKEWAAGGDLFVAASRLTHAAILPSVDAGIYWRGTNRKDEAADVMRGVDIVSTNHVSGEPEHGMSVSLSLATVWAYGYKYAYKVAGTAVSQGSDGEPVLRDVSVIGDVQCAADLLSSDTDRAYTIAQAQAIADACGLTHDQVLWIAYS